MKHILKMLAVSLVAAVVFTGCRSGPVLNIENAPISIQGKHSSNDIGKAIRRAGIGLGWRMNEVKPGHIIGTLSLRSHTAVIDVTYNKDSYSIKYKSSENLNYDGTNIHSNYNGWIKNLDSKIQVQLNLM